MINRPLISVIMPIYNSANYLKEALSSIMNQTYDNFELIIIDDNSNDNSFEIITSYQDKRIRYICPPNRLGLVGSMNYGIDMAQGEFIARMDADDISHRERFALQVQFMQDHPEVGLLGCQYYCINEKGRVMGTFRLPCDDVHIKEYMIINSPIPHPTVMMRKTLLDQYSLRYNPQCNCSEDYDLWARMMPHTEFANLNRKLLKYRMINNSATQRHLQDIKKDDNKYRKIIQIHCGIYENVLNYLGADSSRLRKDYGELLHAKRIDQFSLAEREVFLNQYYLLLADRVQDIKWLRRNMSYLWLKMTKRKFLRVHSIQIILSSFRVSVLIFARNYWARIMGRVFINRKGDCWRI